MNFYPLNDWIITKYTKVEKTSKGGIILATKDEEKKEKLVVAQVVAVGPGKEVEGANGLYFKKMTINIGDVVLYSKYSKGTIESNDDLQEYHNIKESDVVAILK